MTLLRSILIPHLKKDAAGTQMAEMVSDRDELMGFSKESLKEYQRELIMSQAMRDRNLLKTIQQDMIERARKDGEL